MRAIFITWVCDVEAGLPHIVLDVHVGVVFTQQLARLSLSPVRGRVQRSPAVVVLYIDGRAALNHQAARNPSESDDQSSILNSLWNILFD